jgi:putative inorganic carbon (hco3(-)) transporter
MPSSQGEIALRSLGSPVSVESGNILTTNLRLRPVAVLRGALLLLIVANLGRIPVLSTGEREAPILFNDLFVASVVATAGLAMLLARSMRLDRVALAALAFGTVGAIGTVVSIVSYGFSGTEIAVSYAYLARWLLYFALYVAVINTVRAEDTRPVLGAFEGMLLLFAAFGILQSAMLPGFAQMVYPESRVALDWDYQGRRLVSTVLDPNIAGILIVFGLLLHLARLSTGVKVAGWKIVLLLLALVLTVSRSSVLALMAGVAVIVAVRGISRRMLKLGAVVALLGLAALPKIVALGASYNKFGLDDSAMARLVEWAKALRVFADHPIIGVGFNAYGFVLERYGFERISTASYSSDGGLLFIAVLTGVVGLGLYVWMLTIIARRCRAIWRSEAAQPEDRALAVGVAAATLAVCVHSVFVNSLLTTFVMEPLWVMWGLTFVVATRLSDAARVGRTTRLRGSRLPEAA